MYGVWNAGYGGPNMSGLNQMRGDLIEPSHIPVLGSQR